MEKSLQQKYSEKAICFGCGPANPKGLHVNSFPKGDVVVAEWTPKPEYQAFPGVLNGGIVGALLDCHSNWTAAWALMPDKNAAEAPCTVTAEYSIKLMRPTPTDVPLHLEARAVEIKEDRAVIEATLTAKGKVTATCRGTFVAVKPGHPGYYRW